MIDLALDMRQYDCPFIDTTDDHDIAFGATQWEFDRVAERLETRMVVEAGDREALDADLDALRDHRQMHDYDLITRWDGVAQIRTVIAETEAMNTIRDNGGYITGPFHISDGTETWHVGFDESGRADGSLSELERTNEFEVVSRTDNSASEMSDLVQNAGAAMTLIEGCRGLSDTERETLETAVSGGYFDSPREMDLGDLADAFDVSKPAASKNLRRAERKMIERVVSVLDDVE